MSTVYSAFLYLGIFSISILFTYVFITYIPNNIETTKKNITYVVGIIGCIIIVLIPSWLAGARADSVGADTIGYGVLSFKYALGKSREAFLRGQTEVVFYGLAYIVSKLTNNVGVWLGTIELLTFGPILYIAYKQRKQIVPWIVVATFLFKFFNYSLCIMRQSMACSFLILALFLYTEKKYIRSIFWAVITLGIHSTAFIGLLLYLIIILLSSINVKKDINNNKYKYKWVIMVCVLMAIILPKALEILLNSNILPERYVNFNQLFTVGKVTNYSMFESLARLFVIVPSVLVLKKIKRISTFERLILLLSIAGCTLYISGALIWGLGTIYRITEYIDFSFVFSVPIIVKYFKDIKSKYSVIIIAFILIFLYWLIVYIVYPGGMGFETQHYSFR